jgi:hypothetical protein
MSRISSVTGSLANDGFARAIHPPNVLEELSAQLSSGEGKKEGVF